VASVHGNGSLVTGATGLVGRALLKTLSGRVVATTRDASRTSVAGATDVAVWDGVTAIVPAALMGVRTVYHLAGEPVAEGRWTEQKKMRIARSRIDGTRALVGSIAALSPDQRPKVLVSASAVGWYGSRGDEVLTERSAPGEGFLPDVCKAWEQEAERAEELGLRVVRLRIGIVLSTQGGALATMLPMFRLGLAGRLGSGNQYMPWIHIDDVVGLLRFAAERDDVRGPVAAVAPQAVTNAEFTRELGRTVRRPSFFVAPSLALRAVLGESADVVLASQRVVPERALELGYRFAYPTLTLALSQLLGATRASDAKTKAIVL